MIKGGLFSLSVALFFCIFFNNEPVLSVTAAATGVGAAGDRF